MTLADWLLDPPGPDELDERGCYSNEAIVELEARLLNTVQAELETYDGQPAPVTMNPDDRWVLRSALQKAVRFEMPGHAAWVADQMYTLDRDGLLRRLGVIAIEDVFAGDLLATAEALAVLGARDWRRSLGEQRVLRWLAIRLAEAHGDRSAAELLDSGHSDERVDWMDLDRLDEPAMCRLVADPSQPFALRSAVAQLMAGPRFAIGKMPVTPHRTPGPLLQLLVETGTTRWGLFVAARTCSLVRSGMWTTVAVADRWLREGHPTVVPGPEFEKPFVGPVIAAAYDGHTRPGLVAQSRFAKIPRMVRLIGGARPEHRRDVCDLGVFYAEAGSIRSRVVWHDEAQQVFDFIRQGPEHVRWRRPELAAELLPTIGELNDIRRQVLEGVARGADHSARNLVEIGEQEAR